MAPSRSGIHADRNALSSSLAGVFLEHAGANRAAYITGTSRRQIPFRQLGPVATEQELTAVMAVCARGRLIAYVSDIDIPETIFHGDPPGADQGIPWRRGL